ncbi:hypothetical protein FQR65_LT15323 [Abscondita terminalis]|nr:hypothetical protein FQR65_LT15323 [Abscondita terminalis]
MLIREGETSNQIVSEKQYFKIQIEDKGDVLNYEDVPYIMSPLHHNFNATYDFRERKFYSWKLWTTFKGKKIPLELAENGAVEIHDENGFLQIKSPSDAQYMTMATQKTGVAKKDELDSLKLRSLYTIGDLKLVVPEGVKKGRLIEYEGDKKKDAATPDLLRLMVEGPKTKQPVDILVDKNNPNMGQSRLWVEYSRTYLVQKLMHIPAAGSFTVIMMGFAHGGAQLDPQITPLVPVLKSYWLIVHVAIITSSYGFFALSAIIAIITLFFYIVTNSDVYKEHNDKTIKELTIVSEMSLNNRLVLPLLVLILWEVCRTVKENGLFFINPLYSSQRMSLRSENLQGQTLKVNDKMGNPIEIGVVIVWKVGDTYKAAFEVERYTDFVKMQSEAAVRHLAMSFPYDNLEDDHAPITLREGGDKINQILEQELTDRLSKAGIKEWPTVLSLGAFVTLAIGGAVEIIPTLSVKTNIPHLAAVKPYSPLELEGRDLYIREGSMVKTASIPKQESLYNDRPFLWGSKRTGPDLQRQDLVENENFKRLSKDEQNIYLEQKKIPFLRRLWNSAVKKQSQKEEKDLIIDHGFDGITELDNALPKWWIGLFYFGNIFCVIYMLAYIFTDYAHQDAEYEKEQKTMLASIEEYEKNGAKNNT